MKQCTRKSRSDSHVNAKFLVYSPHAIGVFHCFYCCLVQFVCLSCHRHSLPDSLFDLHDVARCDFCRETRDTKPSPCDMYRPLCLYTALPADQAPDNRQRRADDGSALLLETVLRQYKRTRWGNVGQLPNYGLIGLSCIWCEVGVFCV